MFAFRYGVRTRVNYKVSKRIKNKKQAPDKKILNGNKTRQELLE